MSDLSKTTYTETQGNRVFIVITYPSGNEVGYIHMADGLYYTGKSYAYDRCPICRKFTCHMMGGSGRHYRACKRKKEQLESEIQQLNDKNNWSGLSLSEFETIDALSNQYRVLTGKIFEPEYNCPA